MLRRTWVHTARQIWPGLLVVVGVVVAYGVLLSIEPMPEWWRGVCLGFVVGALIVSVLWMIQVFSGSQNLLYGTLGEQGTAEALLTRRMRHRGWALVNGLTFGGHGDVDHALVGPGGVFAVESKWTNEAWSITPTMSHRLDEAMFQARRGARKIESTLRSHHLLDGVTVRPVVVVWGVGAPEVPSGWAEKDGTIVIEGRQAERWTRTLPSDELTAAQASAVAQALRAELDGRVPVS